MNLRQQRTYKYNNIINKEWDSQLFTIENINLINYDNIKLFDAYHIDKLYLNIDHNKQYCNTSIANWGYHDMQRLILIELFGEMSMREVLLIHLHVERIYILLRA